MCQRLWTRRTISYRRSHWQHSHLPHNATPPEIFEDVKKDDGVIIFFAAPGSGTTSPVPSSVPEDHLQESSVCTSGKEYMKASPSDPRWSPRCQQGQRPGTSFSSHFRFHLRQSTNPRLDLLWSRTSWRVGFGGRQGSPFCTLPTQPCTRRGGPVQRGHCRCPPPSRPGILETSPLWRESMGCPPHEPTWWQTWSQPWQYWPRSPSTPFQCLHIQAPRKRSTPSQWRYPEEVPEEGGWRGEWRRLSLRRLIESATEDNTCSLPLKLLSWTPRLSLSLSMYFYIIVFFSFLLHNSVCILLCCIFLLRFSTSSLNVG